MRTGTDLPSLSRALVRIAAEGHAPHPHRSIQRASTFLTQLIATARRLPQAAKNAAPIRPKSSRPIGPR